MNRELLRIFVSFPGTSVTVYRLHPRHRLSASAWWRDRNHSGRDSPQIFRRSTISIPAGSRSITTQGCLSSSLTHYGSGPERMEAVLAHHQGELDQRVWRIAACVVKNSRGAAPLCMHHMIDNSPRWVYVPGVENYSRHFGREPYPPRTPASFFRRPPLSTNHMSVRRSTAVIAWLQRKPAGGARLPSALRNRRSNSEFPQRRLTVSVATRARLRTGF